MDAKVSDLGLVMHDMSETPDMTRNVVFYRYVDLLGGRASFDCPEWRSKAAAQDPSFAVDRLKEAKKIYPDDCCIGWAYSDDLAALGKKRLGKY